MPAIESAPSLESDDFPQGLAEAPPFPTSADSPFPDGYDIATERDALEDLLLSENPDPDDPRWARLVELRNREEALRRPSREEPPEAPPPVTAESAPRRHAEFGLLFDATPDTITLHTKDAHRLLTGRLTDPENRLESITSGRRFAAILRSLWYLTEGDNPYADWMLLRMDEGLAAIRAHLRGVIRRREETIEQLRSKGIAISVMASRNPVTLDIGFRSPYGYATAEAVADFDYYARMVRTLVLKDRLSNQEGREAISAVGREFRALFAAPVRWERHLTTEVLLPLSRSDFLPGVDEAARRRVYAAVLLFGELPRKVFTGAQLPRHSRRRALLSEAERRLLEQVPLGVKERTPRSAANTL